MEYCTRKKKERSVEKSNIMDDIKKVEALISEGSPDQRLTLLEAQLNKFWFMKPRVLSFAPGFVGWRKGKKVQNTFVI